MIFVITGTEKYPFDRLIKCIDNFSQDGLVGNQVFIQLGSCIYEPKYCRWKRFISFGQMCEKIQESDIIIAHAGAGTTLLCIQLGHHPILVPRQKKYGEHLDNHQVSFAKRFAYTGMINVVYEIKDLAGYIHGLESTKAKYTRRESTRKARLLGYLEAFYENV